ncbi:MAG TPA: hypothetical protein VH541_05715 [Gaiellaceae bacterium]|jgi:hypothetical protein
MGKRVTLQYGRVCVDVGPAVVNGREDEGVRLMRDERTGHVFRVLARVVDAKPVTLRRDSFRWHPDELAA